MNPRLRIAFFAAAGLAGLAIMWQLAKWTYLNERSEIDEHVAVISETIGTYRTAVVRGIDTERAIRSIVDQTLGASQETVDHRLRTNLNRIKEAVGLGDAAVDTPGNASVRDSPARSALRKMRMAKSLTDTPDFAEVEGWVTGEGTLAQIVELVDRIDAEPWIKRFNQFRIDGKADGDRFAFTVRLTTLFLPGREPSGEVASTSYDRTRLDTYAPFVNGNLFKVAAPVVVVEEHKPDPPPPPEKPRFPWGQWSLTGVADGPMGLEAWLRNQKSGETRQLRVGEQLNEAILIAAAGEWAEFQMHEERFRVRIGGNMNDRTPMTE